MFNFSGLRWCCSFPHWINIINTLDKKNVLLSFFSTMQYAEELIKYVFVYDRWRGEGCALNVFFFFLTLFDVGIKRIIKYYYWIITERALFGTVLIIKVKSIIQKVQTYLYNVLLSTVRKKCLQSTLIFYLHFFLSLYTFQDTPLVLYNVMYYYNTRVEKIVSLCAFECITATSCILLFRIYE